MGNKWYRIFDFSFDYVNLVFSIQRTLSSGNPIDVIYAITSAASTARSSATLLSSTYNRSISTSQCTKFRMIRDSDSTSHLEVYIDDPRTESSTSEPSYIFSVYGISKFIPDKRFNAIALDPPVAVPSELQTGQGLTLDRNIMDDIRNTNYNSYSTNISPSVANNDAYFPLFKIKNTGNENSMYGSYLITCSRRASTGDPSTFGFVIHGFIRHELYVDGETLYFRAGNTTRDQCDKIRIRYDSTNQDMYIDGHFTASGSSIINAYRFHLHPLGTVTEANVTNNNFIESYDNPAALSVNPPYTLIKEFNISDYFLRNTVNNNCFRKNNNAAITDLNTISPGAAYNFNKANVANLPRDAGNAEFADVLTLGIDTQKYQLYCGRRTNKAPILNVRGQYGNNTSGWSDWGTIPIGLLDYKSFIQSGNTSNSLVKYTDEFIASAPNYSLEQAIHFILIQKTTGGTFSLYVMIGYATGSTRSFIKPIIESSHFSINHYSTDNDGKWFKVITGQFGYKVTIIGVGTNRISYYDKLEMVPYTES